MKERGVQSDKHFVMKGISSLTQARIQQIKKYMDIKT